MNVDGDLIVDVNEGDVNVLGGHYNNYIVYESGISHISNDEIGIDIEDVIIAREQLESDKISDKVAAEPTNEIMVEADEITTESSENELIIDSNNDYEVSEIIEETVNEEIPDEIPSNLTTEVHLDKNSQNKNGVLHRVINKIKNVLK